MRSQNMRFLQELAPIVGALLSSAVSAAFWLAVLVCLIVGSV